MLLTEGDMTRQFPGPGIVVLLLCCAGVPATAAPPGGPDPEAVALIEALDIREAAAPVRDWPRWRKPEKVAVYLPQRLRPLS